MSASIWKIGIVTMCCAALCACQGALDGGALSQEEMGVASHSEMGVDAGVDADQGQPMDQGMERPVVIQDAFLASEHHSEFELEVSELGGLDEVEGLRGVVSAPNLGVYAIGEQGLFEIIDGARVQLKVPGEIVDVQPLGSRALVLVMGGEAYLYEGGELRLLLGGILERGEVQALMRRGDEVWLATEVALWRVARDPLRGDNLWEYEPIDGVVRAFWGAQKSGQVVYAREDGAYGVFDIEQRGRSRLTLMSAGDALYPMRSHRLAAVLNGQLAEWYQDAWWWRTLGSSAQEMIQSVHPSIQTLSPDSGALWTVDPGVETLWRVEAGWSARAVLPQELRGASLQEIKSARGDELWARDAQERWYLLRARGLSAPEGLDPPAGPVSFTQDIQPIAQAMCQGCHITGQGGALFRLESYQDWRASLPVVVSSVRSGRMPKETDPIPSFADLLEQWQRDGFLE